MDQPLIHVIVTNYKRPRATEMAIAALRCQTLPIKLSLVDNHPPISHVKGDSDRNKGFRLSPMAMDLVDDVWTISKNHGPPCRFGPALLQHDCRYVYFHDEDMLPGPRALEHLLATADGLGDRFSTISEFGRRMEYRDKQEAARSTKLQSLQYGWHYSTMDVERKPDEPIIVDCTCRAHFVLAKYVHEAIAFKQWLIDHYGQWIIPCMGLHRHDDLLLSYGIWKASGWPCYLTPSSTPLESIGSIELSEYPAASRVRDEHKLERTRFVRRMASLGWEPLWEPEPTESVELAELVEDDQVVSE